MTSPTEGESRRARDGASSHRDAIEHYRRRSHAPGMDAISAARNRYCGRCGGVCAFEATACPHCGEPLPRERIEWFNFSDFEPDLEGAEARAIRRTLALIGLAALALALWWILS